MFDLAAILSDFKTLQKAVKNKENKQHIIAHLNSKHDGEKDNKELTSSYRN